jgi:sugar lactone lactonase YvrE
MKLRHVGLCVATARYAVVSIGLALGLLAGSGRALAAPSEVTIPGDHVFPESLTATADGTLIIGSLGQGAIYRAAPGASRAELWIKPGTAGMMSVLGVLADERSGTLWACSSDLSAAGVTIPGGQKPVALKAFDLKSGAPKGSVPLPGQRTFCNDIAIGPDGAAYVTDSFNPHVLRLKPGASAFEVWATDDRFTVKNGAGLDGIAFGGDGKLYVNLYNGNALFQIDVNSDGSAGKVTQLQPSQPIALCDGMRKLGTNTLLMIEGTGKLDRVSVDGDHAKIDLLKSGYKTPVSVVQVGDIAWVLEGQLTDLFGPHPGKPGPFRAYAVSLQGSD